MQVKILNLFAIGFIFSTSLQAIDPSKRPLSPANPARETPNGNLENLEKMHNYNEIFDNYQLGGIAPDIDSGKKR